jgi:RNA polymerase sigma-70 factor (ECF subfamily)
LFCLLKEQFRESPEFFLPAQKDMQSDREILDLFHKQGAQEKAFSLLMRKYDQRLYMHIRRVVTEHADADDVMQNTFMKIWKGLPAFRSESSLFTWMYRIATNECINHLQRRNKHQFLSFDGNEDGEDVSSNFSYAAPETHFLEAAEIEKRLKNAIEQLPDKQKIVFSMRYYDELSYEQMSEILGTSVRALKASYHHAVLKVEKHLTLTSIKP